MTVDGLVSPAYAYDYVDLLQPPVITSVSPLTGTLAGGTIVTIIGSGFKSSADVSFVPARAGGGASAAAPPLACEWRGSDDALVCTDTTIRCRAPSADGTVSSYTVTVSVEHIVTPYTRSSWVYNSPSVTAVSPSTFPPLPLPPVVFNVTGSDFGDDVGTVTIDGAAISCPVWNTTALTCLSPYGVAASVDLVVTAVSGLVSSPVQVHFRAPSITTVTSPPALSTVGGDVVVVTGADFNISSRDSGGNGTAAANGTANGTLKAVAAASVSVWFVRVGGGSLPTPPWTNADNASSHLRLQCPLMLPRCTPQSLVCVAPVGVGRNWHIVVVNHEATPSPNDTLSTAVWQRSNPSVTTLTYAAPVVFAVSYPAGLAAPRPAVGGFAVTVTGAHFGRYPPVVTIAGLLCGTVATAVANDTVVTCLAPSRRVDADAAVVVSQDGLSSLSGGNSSAVQLWYDGPVVTSVSPTTIAAVDGVDGAVRPRLSVIGVNFGVKYSTSVVGDHRVTLGDTVSCAGVAWVSDTLLTCAVVGTLPAGPYDVRVTLQNDTSHGTSVVVVTAECPFGMYGGAGEACLPCPAGARCIGGMSDPIALPGYYPSSRALFIPCQPVTACLGDVNASEVATGAAADGSGVVSCADGYHGQRCADCRPQWYRLRLECRPCPNTAWLLFLLFAVALVAAAAAAMYLSKTKINFAGLGIGVVSARQCRLCVLPGVCMYPCTLLQHCVGASASCGPAMTESSRPLWALSCGCWQITCCAVEVFVFVSCRAVDP